MDSNLELHVSHATPGDAVAGSEASAPALFCPFKGFLGAASREFSRDTGNLLRRRLTVVAGLFGLGATLFLIQGILIQAPWWVERFAPVGINLGIFFLLMSKRDFSQRQLRLFEYAIFGSMLLHLVVVKTLGVRQLAEQGSAFAVGQGLVFLTTGFFFVIITYGMFIPNTWRRALAVTLPMFALGIAVELGLSFFDPNVRAMSSGSGALVGFSYRALLLVMSVVIAVVGAHVIHRVRRDAAEAREMGLYQLEKKLGEGGMGEVWKANHRLLARPAAIKTIRPDVLHNAGGSDTAVERFRREAQTTGSLRSPHTIELYDFGVTKQGTFFYVMEYLDGIDLEQLVQRFGPQPAERVAHFLQQATNSLEEAHRHGLVHRDVKPSNLQVCNLGGNYDFVKVLDFGLVTRQQDKPDPGLTMEGRTTGTPAYMAPEMAVNPHEIDARADVYALGCVAYWLLTGQRVFESDNPMAVVIAHVKTAPAPPSQRTELKIPAGLDELVLACLEKDPDERPQSMAELQKRLDALPDVDTWTTSRAAAWWSTHLPQQAA